MGSTALKLAGKAEGIKYNNTLQTQAPFLPSHRGGLVARLIFLINI